MKQFPDVPDPEIFPEDFKRWAAQKRAAWDQNISAQMQARRAFYNGKFRDAIR